MRPKALHRASGVRRAAQPAVASAPSTDHAGASSGVAGAGGNQPLRGFSRSLPMALMRARESLMCRFRPMLRAHGVTEQQWRVLRALQASGALEVSDLARASFLLGPSLTRILRDLETRGLVAREPVAHDLRRSAVAMTEAGRGLIDRVAPHSEAIYAEIAQRFGAARLEALLWELADLETAMADGTTGETDDPDAGDSDSSAAS